jgi:hypothetical protein
VLLYFKDGDGPEEMKPEWVVYSSHGGHGEENRRAWDPNQVGFEGTHPIVYVAAGSHANYYNEELKRLEKTFSPGGSEIGAANGLPWAEPMSLENPWCVNYRGRWGVRQNIIDRLAGPPTGPKFNRDGSHRLEWQRPLDYADLK